MSSQSVPKFYFTVGDRFSQNATALSLGLNDGSGDFIRSGLAHKKLTDLCFGLLLAWRIMSRLFWSAGVSTYLFLSC